MLKRICFILGLSLSCATGASATTMSGILTADDAFNAYLSSSDSVLGTQIASSTYWGSPGSFSSVNLTPGTTYYLHVDARDLYGPPSGFLGSLSLAGTGFTFSNGGQTLATNTTDWKVSLTGFGANYVAPTGGGVNGVSPWGTFSSIAPGAQWIWTGPQGQVGVSRYFSTTIAAVPEPETYAMLMAGLSILGVVARRKKQTTAV